MKRLIYIPLLLLALTGYSQNVFRIPAPDTLPSEGGVFRISPSVVYLTGITISSSPTLCLGDTVYLTSRNATGYDSLQWKAIGEDDSPLTGTFLTGTTANTYYVPSATDLAGDMRFYLVGYSVVYQADEDIITFQSIQPATLDQVSITFQTKTTSDTIYIDWGDGSALVPVTGTANQTKTSNYSANNTTYDIRILGDIDQIKKFYIFEYHVTFGSFTNNISKMTNLDELSLYRCTGEASFVASDIPSTVKTLFLYQIPNITTTLVVSDLPPNLTNLSFFSAPDITITGDLTDFPALLTANLVISGCDATITYTTGALPAWTNVTITLTQVGWNTTTTDAFLNSWAATAGTGTRTITITDAARSSASDAAVATLRGRGKTIVTLGRTEAP